MNSVEYDSAVKYYLTINSLMVTNMIYIQRRVTLSITIGAYTKLQSIPYCNFSVYKNGSSLIQLRTNQNGRAVFTPT